MGFQITMQGIVAIAPRSMDKLIITLARLYETNRPLLPIVRALRYFQIPYRPAFTLQNRDENRRSPTVGAAGG